MQVRNTTDMTAKTKLLDATRHLFSIFMPMEQVGAFAHGLGVFLLMVGTVLGGGLASAQLYQNATPGQMLYGVKLSVEKAQLLLAPNDEYETNLHVKFADNRMEEISRLSEQGEEQQALVPGVLAAFDKEVAALAAGLDAMRADGHGGTTETAKLMERKMAYYMNELRRADVALGGSHHFSLAHSRDLVDGTTLKAMAVIVEGHLANDASVSRTVVETKFTERIQQAEANLTVAAEAEVKPAAAKAKAAIAEAKELLKNQDYKAALTKIEEVAQLTKEADEEGAKVEAEAAAEAEAEVEAGAETQVETETEVKAEGEAVTPAAEDASAIKEEVQAAP